ncbi:hypothetical protein Bca4012_060411 [Brassica carinata]|uniref:Uncharacterized protein n=1 Tax=Brassica carinata TaxID=52824 RepID=A0A8X7V4P4_BRACI|nr:hypothetical protein Bca52824_030738 [Brassica carinata]
MRDHNVKPCCSKKKNVNPDESTYPFVVKAISQLWVLPSGFALHAHVVKNGFETLGIVATELVMNP